MTAFKLTAKQQDAQALLAGNAAHCMLFGGSRSGKTFLLTRNVIMRALKAPKSRHAVLRYRFNAVKQSIVFDTLPKVMEMCFASVPYTLNKSEWFIELPNGSQVWFGGLDDKGRTEKILGQEYATIYLNECSQIPFNSRGIAVTRLAQQATQVIEGAEDKPLKPRMYYDCNPPPKSHWTYKLFRQKVDPDSGLPLNNPDNYVSFQINPVDNVSNLADGYIETLKALSPRLQKRFLAGEFGDATPNQLFADECIDTWRVNDGKTPDFVRVIVSVDPSGSGDTDNADNDAIGISVTALGTDGNAYVLEDLTVKAGPATWGRVAVSAYERHKADVIVGEGNYGGDMVRFTVQTANPRVNFKLVSATRGKVVRAEPISALYEVGKVRHVGRFPELEDEMSGFSTNGYTGSKSPNRADALIWGLTELFPGVVKQPKAAEPANDEHDEWYANAGWMA